MTNEDQDHAYDVARSIALAVDHDTLVRYAADDSGNMSLDCYRSLITTRMGETTDAQWAEACELIRERFSE